MTTTQARLLRIGRHDIEVTRLAPAPALPPVTVEHELECVAALKVAAAAGLLPGTPPAGFGESLARASTEDPQPRNTRIRTGIVTDRTDTADIAVLRTVCSPFTVIPGDQPRGGSAGGRTTQVREPARGHDEAADRLGLREMLFDDIDHLHDWCADSLERSLTRALKRGRPAEIAATGVRRPVSASMVMLQFADGTAPQWVPMLSDGISRLAVCAASLLGLLEADPTEAALTIARRMLPVAALDDSSPPHKLAREMRRSHNTLVSEYSRHVDEDGADEHAVLMRQFLSLPVDLHLLATDPATGRPHPMEPVMEAVVSDFHTGVDGWGAEDESRHVALRALKRLLQDGDIDPRLFDICTNKADLDTAPGLRTAPDARPETARPDSSSSAAPGAPSMTPSTDRLLLRRAVTVIAALFAPANYPAFKTALRSCSGRQRLTVQQVVEYAAPLVCEPWGARKPITRAWAYGGPVPTWIRDTHLLPRHPIDYLELVDTAMDPDTAPANVVAARLELALAGGTALIADGVLTTAVVGGSGSAPTPLPFRGPVNAAVDALTQTEEGLIVLAVAANHFRPSRSSRTARLPNIDLDRADKVARDGVGVPVRITETVLAGYAAAADPERNQVDDTRGGPRHATTEPTPLENLRNRARHLPTEARTLMRDVELTKALHDETGGPTGLSEHDLDTVHDSLSVALRLAGRLT